MTKVYMKDFSHLKVGDKVWVTKPNYHKRDSVELEEETVTKVGRKYITVGEPGWREAKFFIDDGVEAEETYRKMVHSKEEHFEELYVDRLYKQIKSVMGDFGRRPDGISSQDIIEAARLLKIDLKLENK